ncbi:VanZ family protein [Brasilonema bromeliae]|uniref:VanZ family protein n=1 Tax=Brasilonema bromeliae SPC951 TaxID=385972 RepID=A0ABX1PCG4_9CYAN|nr:VanZ family protein [Brasilonema bromeliae]NMG21092.1 VanZ family protein [Brasilonema bromeliae SPC951]
MKRRKNVNSISKNLGISGDVILIILSIVSVLIATLYPFHFHFPDSFSLPALVASFDNSSFFKDQVNNILLFTPLGFGFASLLQRMRMKPTSQFIIVIFLSAGLSFTVEALQVFLPSRTPTPADILNNTIGGFVGLICFSLWNSQSFLYTLMRRENSRSNNSIKKLTLCFLGYIIISFLISVLWQNTTNLSNWSLNYPLLIGNERTGDRPWQGQVSDVYIADRAISKNEVSQVFHQKNYSDIFGKSLLASYQLTDTKSYQDSTGQLPELLSQGQLPDIEDEKGVVLSSNHWLKTTEPVTFLSKRIRETSQFTIITTVATANTAQTGPARVISLSGDSLHRNFTLGQQGTDLDLRIRTPMTGANGADTKLTIPDIFADTNPHHIVITYSGATIQVYVDKSQHSYSLNLLEWFPKEQKIFYYALTFIPLGLCLALLTTLAKRKLTFNRLLLPSGILLPSVILESILVTDGGKSLSLKGLLLGILLTAGTTLTLRWRASMVLKTVRAAVNSTSRS